MHGRQEDEKRFLPLQWFIYEYGEKGGQAVQIETNQASQQTQRWMWRYANLSAMMNKEHFLTPRGATEE